MSVLDEALIYLFFFFSILENSSDHPFNKQWQSA